MTKIDELLERVEGLKTHVFDRGSTVRSVVVLEEDRDALVAVIREQAREIAALKEAQELHWRKRGALMSEVVELRKRHYLVVGTEEETA